MGAELLDGPEGAFGPGLEGVAYAACSCRGRVRGWLGAHPFAPLAACPRPLGGLCGAVTRRMIQRQYAVFGDVRFERLAGLSNSHLYRLRESTTYRRRRLVVARTRSTQVQIGERRKPHPAGRPGFLRVDSVHQGDLDGEKGLYEINLVDEVTQYEFVAAVEGISERFLVPALPLPRRDHRREGTHPQDLSLRQGHHALPQAQVARRPRPNLPVSSFSASRLRLPVPALPLVPGADLCFASISSPETRPAALSRRNSRRTPFRLISVWDYASRGAPSGGVRAAALGRPLLPPKYTFTAPRPASWALA